VRQRRKIRQDLYYRLNVIELHLPPLRERLQDIALLAQRILQKFSSPDYPVVLNQEALSALSAYEFPGNVRELENILERAVAFADNGQIMAQDLALRGRHAKADADQLAQSQQTPNELKKSREEILAAGGVVTLNAASVQNFKRVMRFKRSGL